MNRTVLVTGAAGLIGSATVSRLLEENSKVILVDINKEALSELCSRLELKYRENQFYSICADAATSAGCNEVFAKASQWDARFDSVVHCAYPRTPSWGTAFEEVTDLHLRDNLGMQLGGAILVSQKAIQHFLALGGGSLVHVSSIQGIMAPKFNHYEGTSMTSPIEYSAIKAGVIAITRWLAKYSSGHNIRVNCVSPGGVEAGQPESFLQSYRNSCTNIGMLSGVDVAQAIVYLLSPDAHAINGHNLVVDDGWSL